MLSKFYLNKNILFFHYNFTNIRYNDIGEVMENRKIIRIVLLSIIFVLLILFVFGLRKMYLKSYEKKLVDIDWLRKNVSIEENSKLGNGIYYVKKNADINIYNKNYRKVISEKFEEIRDKKYSLYDPLIIYNLYGTNLLSLNIYFETEELSSVDYTISVSDKNISSFSRTLKNNGEDNLTKNHEYQIIGFVNGYINTLKLTVKDKNEKVIEEKEIKVDFRDIKTNSNTTLEVTDGSSTQELSEGLYVHLGNDSGEQDYVSLYDNDGILRGEIPIIGYRAHDILFKEDKMYFSISQTKIASINSLGEVTKVYNTGNYYLHHDYTFDDDGNILVLANNRDKTTEEDCIIKINLDTKEVTEILDLEDMFKSYVETCELDKESVRDEGEDGLDWIHINSIEYVDGDIIISSRETSSIIRINNIEDNPTLKYILSDKALWENTDYIEYVYEKVGDFKIHAGQHYVRYIPSKEEGVYYLTLFDNNYGKQTSQPQFDYKTIGITNTNPFNGDNSYYYKYKVDENNNTFELIDSFEVLYSGIVSSSKTMENNNIVIDSGTKGVYAEYDEYHNLIRKYKVSLNKYMLYRVIKYDFNDFWFE